MGARAEEWEVRHRGKRALRRWRRGRLWDAPPSSFPGLRFGGGVFNAWYASPNVGTGEVHQAQRDVLWSHGGATRSLCGMWGRREWNPRKVTCGRCRRGGSPMQRLERQVRQVLKTEAND